jgi:hypothetical protein
MFNNLITNKKIIEDFAVITFLMISEMIVEVYLVIVFNEQDYEALGAAPHVVISGANQTILPSLDSRARGTF